MSLGAWLFVVFVVAPLASVLAWALARESLVQVPVGCLGLLVVRGKSTNKALVPGVHWVPALRKRQCVIYPSVELSYRAGAEGPSTSVESFGPPQKLLLGDRAEATVSYTVRFRLAPETLRLVHDRFGSTGYWSAVRDGTSQALASALGEPDVTVDSVYPGERAALEEQVTARITTALEEDGMTLAGFSIGEVDLGRTGETVQATVRARLELAREDAEASLQELRVRHDADLAQYLTGDDIALRYRQAQIWRDLAYRPETPRLSIPVPAPVAGIDPTPLGPAAEPTSPTAGEGAV